MVPARVDDPGAGVQAAIGLRAASQPAPSMTASPSTTTGPAARPRLAAHRRPARGGQPAAPSAKRGRPNGRPLGPPQPQPTPDARGSPSAAPGRSPRSEHEITVNATTILDPALGADYDAEEALAQRALILCRTPPSSSSSSRRPQPTSKGGLASPRVATPTSSSEPARDLMDTIEGWLDDLPGAFNDLLVFAEAC